MEEHNILMDGRLATLVKEWLRPNVIIDFVLRGNVNALYFRVRNVGALPAYDIEFSLPSPPPKFCGISGQELNLLQRGISVLAPGDEVVVFFDTVPSLQQEDPDMYYRFRVEVEYGDIPHSPQGWTWVEAFELDPYLWVNTSALLPDGDRIVTQLSGLRRDLRNGGVVYHTKSVVRRFARWLLNVTM